MLNYANVNEFWSNRSYFMLRSVKGTVPEPHPLLLIRSETVSHSVNARSRDTVTGLHVALVCSLEYATHAL